MIMTPKNQGHKQLLYLDGKQVNEMTLGVAFTTLGLHNIINIHNGYIAFNILV